MVQGDHKRSDGVRELTAIDLLEISIVPAPANPDTRFVSLKSVAEEEDAGPPTDAELRHHAEQLGIIEPDPEYVRIRDRARDEMLHVLGYSPESDEALPAKAAALGIDLERKAAGSIKVATFEV